MTQRPLRFNSHLGSGLAGTATGPSAPPRRLPGPFCALRRQPEGERAQKMRRGCEPRIDPTAFPSRLAPALSDTGQPACRMGKARLVHRPTVPLHAG
jgi:hypothetical protein